jgi:hypothetical protein
MTPPNDGNGNGNGYGASIAELRADLRNLKERFRDTVMELHAKIDELQKKDADNQRKLIGALFASIVTLAGFILKQLGIY